RSTGRGCLRLRREKCDGKWRSCSTLNDKTRDFAQKIGARLEGLEMRRCLIDKKRGLSARPLDAEDRDERRLARGGILADRLAGDARGTFDIEKIVRDLKGEAEIMRISA